MPDFVTAEELAAALPRVLAAPGSGYVHTLCTRAGFNQRHFPERLAMTRAKGVEADFGMSKPWLTLVDGSPDPRIQVSILPLRVLELVWLDRNTMPHPGDTIIADLDVTEASLPAGSLIKAGTAILRVSDLWNNGCAKWRARYGVPAYKWVSAPEHEKYRLRGVLCSIEQDGEVSLGDAISRV